MLHWTLNFETWTRDLGLWTCISSCIKLHNRLPDSSVNSHKSFANHHLQICIPPQHFFRCSCITAHQRPSAPSPRHARRILNPFLLPTTILISAFSSLWCISWFPLPDPCHPCSSAANSCLATLCPSRLRGSSPLTTTLPPRIMRSRA
jgi:hypothetical protein